MSSMTAAEGAIPFEKDFYKEHIPKLCEPAIAELKSISQAYMAFHIAFIALGVVEVFLFLLLFASLAKSALLAYSLALIFLTSFAYLILRLYFQSRKPEQLLEIRNRYSEGCKNTLRFQEGIPEHHMLLANATCRFAASLQELEYSFYTLSSRKFDYLGPLLEKFSCFWHWRDVHKMQELLLFDAIEEFLKLIKCEPTNLEVHAMLANCYVLLSTLYIDPRTLEDFDEEKWIPPGRCTEEMNEKFLSAAKRAIEEFNILKEYAPNDPWVHEQLAYSYRDLQMPEEEITEYEIIVNLKEGDLDAIYNLGVLYFQQGHNAKGLRVYEKLKTANYQRAEDLISFYGAFTPA